MTNSIERYKRRKKIIKESKHQNLNIVNKGLIDEYLNSEADSRKNEILFNHREKFEIKTFKSDKTPQELLKEIEGGFEDKNLEDLLTTCKDEVLKSIIVPFGLGKILFEDKDGGNITTVNNFKKGIIATEEDKVKYDNFIKIKNDNFSRKEYENDTFKAKRKSELQKNSLKDGYSGKEIPKDGRSHLEHITSASEIERDPVNNLFMTKEEKIKMANSDKNLTMILASPNLSKKEKDLKKWASAENSKNKGKTNLEYYNLDENLVNDKYKGSKQHISRVQVKAQLKKQGKEVIKTGTKEAGKMALQQSLGILLKEFTEACFLEVKDIYKNGFKENKISDGFIDTLKKRLNNIKERIISKWKDIVVAFKDGAISGFFSNLITFIINSFLTTTKKIVRIIREGFFSLVQAVKLVANPPQGMKKNEALYQASKLVISGVILAGGILIEEGVEKFLLTIPGIQVIAHLVSPVVVGIISGLLSSICIYGFDKLDIFNIKDEKKHSFIIENLNEKMGKDLEAFSEAAEMFGMPKIEF